MMHLAVLPLEALCLHRELGRWVPSPQLSAKLVTLATVDFKSVANGSVKRPAHSVAAATSTASAPQRQTLSTSSDRENTSGNFCRHQAQQQCWRREQESHKQTTQPSQPQKLQQTAAAQHQSRQLLHASRTISRTTPTTSIARFANNIKKNTHNLGVHPARNKRPSQMHLE